MIGIGIVPGSEEGRKLFVEWRWNRTLVGEGVVVSGAHRVVLFVSPKQYGSNLLCYSISVT